MLYRIDILTPDGETRAVSDLLGPRLITRWATARVVAIDAAKGIRDEAGFSRILRIDHAGRTSVAGYVRAGEATVRMDHDRRTGAIPC